MSRIGLVPRDDRRSHVVFQYGPEAAEPRSVNAVHSSQALDDGHIGARTDQSDSAHHQRKRLVISALGIDAGREADRAHATVGRSGGQKSGRDRLEANAFTPPLAIPLKVATLHAAPLLFP